MDEKMPLLKEMAKAADYFGRRLRDAGVSSDIIANISFSSDGYLNCNVEVNGIRYEAVRLSNEDSEIDYRMKFAEDMEEFDDDLPFV